MNEPTAPAMQAATSAARTTTDRAGTVALWAAGAAALALPIVLAFFGGGFGLRRASLALVFVLPILAAAAALAPRPLVPRGWAPRLALAGLVAYSAWAALSISWARILGDASEDAYRLGLYCAAFLLALIGLRVDTLRRVAPWVLLAGTLVVALYALAGRLLPSIVEQTETPIAGSRLSQPLTYWNAMGILMAMGAVLGVASAADERLAPRLRAAAGAAAVPCTAALWLTFSRASLVAFAAGLVFVLMLRPTRRQALAAAAVLGAGVLAVVAIELLPAVSSIEHPDGTRTKQGAAFAAGLVVLSAAAAALIARAGAADAPLPLGRRLRTAVLLATVPAVLALGALVASRGESVENVATGPGRVTTLDTNRDQLWRVGLDSFADHPLTGIGTASFQVEWLREREERDSALDAHSLYIETLAELGIVGGLLLAAFLAAVTAGLVRRARVAPGDPLLVAAAGALVAFAVHAGFDWDWEMPTVALLALVLAAAALQPPEADAAETRLAA